MPRVRHCLQAYGAKSHQQLPTIFWRATGFTLLLCLPLLGLVMLLPSALQLIGRSPGFCVELRSYLLPLLPTVVAVAQQQIMQNMLMALEASMPILIVNSIALGLHAGFNYLLLRVLGVGLIGAAVASSLTNLSVLLLLGVGAKLWGLGPTIWGVGPTRAAL